MAKPKTILRTGVAGSVIAALCCFTPVLALLLGALGLGSALAWLDFILLPALVFFVALTGYGWWRCRQ